MYRREEAQQLLLSKQTANWTERCLSAIRNELPEELRPAAYALLNHNEHGEPINYPLYTRETIQRHRESVERSLNTLAALDPTRRIAIFSALVPRTASIVEAALQLRGRLPYHFRGPSPDFPPPRTPAPLYTAPL